jgi:excisionase family DNA binding protein
MEVAMGQLVGLAEVAEYLGLTSKGRRPGNRVWELLKAGKLRGLPYLRIGRRYRFNMADVDAWVKRQMTANGSNGMLRLR